MAKLLLASGADATLRDGARRSAAARPRARRLGERGRGRGRRLRRRAGRARRRRPPAPPRPSRQGGRTPLALAKENGKTEVVALLTACDKARKELRAAMPGRLTKANPERLHKAIEGARTGGCPRDEIAKAEAALEQVAPGFAAEKAAAMAKELFDAAREGDQPAVQRLLAQGAPPDEYRAEVRAALALPPPGRP